MRTQILHKIQRKKLQSIIVSINPSEGKSVTALNLSCLLAQANGVKALTIESDLQMLRLTDYLGIETDKRLSDILYGNAQIFENQLPDLNVFEGTFTNDSNGIVVGMCGSILFTDDAESFRRLAA